MARGDSVCRILSPRERFATIGRVVDSFLRGRRRRRATHQGECCWAFIDPRSNESSLLVLAPALASPFGRIRLP